MNPTLESTFPAAVHPMAEAVRAWFARSPSSATRALRAPRAHAFAKDAVLVLPDPRGQTVECLEGSLWITFDHDLRDVVLEAGQKLVIDRAGPGLLQALERSRIALTPRAR